MMSSDDRNLLGFFILMKGQIFKVVRKHRTKKYILGMQLMLMCFPGIFSIPKFPVLFANVFILLKMDFVTHQIMY